MSEEQKKEFKNRQSNKTNQRVLKIEDIVKNEYGEIDELIVSVERYDEVIFDEENPEADYSGTRLDAESLNEIVREMILEIKKEEDALENEEG